jgi:hypothetical protein
MMDTTTAIAIVCLAVLCCTMAFGFTAIATIMWWRSQSKLMWFHKAGDSIAAHEIKVAELELQKREMELRRTDAETARIRAESESRDAKMQVRKLTG